LIVSSFHDGDDDMELALKQHNVYGQALRIIISTCNRYAAFAKALLEETDHKDWGRIEECDHRTLQFGHDLLASAWRFRNDFRQGKLPFEGPDHSPPAESLWLDWLRNEISGWIDQPYLVRSVQLILTNQNQLIGYIAESQWCLDIMRHFPDVPWRGNLRDAFEKDLANDMEKLRKAAASAETKE